MSHPTTSPSQRTSSRKQPTHSGEGHLVNNLVTFVVMFALMLAGIFSLVFFDKENVWPFAVCLALFTAAFLIPQAILGRSDTGLALAQGDRKA